MILHSQQISILLLEEHSNRKISEQCYRGASEKETPLTIFPAALGSLGNRACFPSKVKQQKHHYLQKI